MSRTTEGKAYPMAVQWTQLFNWGPIYNPGELQNNYWRVPFAGQPHIVASAYLNTASFGTLNGVHGVATACFKRFEFFDEQGLVQETELTSLTSFIEVRRCVSITFAFDLRAAFAEAGWTVHFLG
jgi:hypothetical protein